MILRAIRYCSTFQLYLNERESLRMALLLNKYPNELISKQFQLILEKFKINEEISTINYNIIRNEICSHPNKEKQATDYKGNLFIHFTYCSSMSMFPKKFHILWNKYFEESPINEVRPILGTRNVKNIQRRLAFNM